jgi:hypothetical protein
MLWKTQAHSKKEEEEKMYFFIFCVFFTDLIPVKIPKQV